MLEKQMAQKYEFKYKLETLKIDLVVNAFKGVKTKGKKRRNRKVENSIILAMFLFVY